MEDLQRQWKELDAEMREKITGEKNPIAVLVDLNNRIAKVETDINDGWKSAGNSRCEFVSPINKKEGCKRYAERDTKFCKMHNKMHPQWINDVCPHRCSIIDCPGKKMAYSIFCKEHT